MTEKPDHLPEYLARLADEGADVHLIIAADKLANARSMLNDVTARGEQAMTIFTGGIDGTQWYLGQMCALLLAGPIADSPLVAELLRTRDQLAAALG